MINFILQRLPSNNIPRRFGIFGEHSSLDRQDGVRGNNLSSMLVGGTLAINRAVVAIKERGRPYFNRNLLLMLVFAFSMFQLFLLTMKTSADHDIRIVRECLSNRLIIATAGFCLGFISLILVDLMVDLSLAKSHELFISRILFLSITIIYSFFVFCNESIPSIGLTYIIYRNFTLVFVCGRAFLDLCTHDTTRSWTMNRVVPLLGTCSAGLLFTSFHRFSDNSHLYYTGLSLGSIYVLLLACNWCTCFRRVLKKHSESSFIEAVRKLSHDDCIVLLISGILVVSCFLILIVLELLALGLSRGGVWSAWYQCSDHIIRAIFVTSIALLPSAIQKHKSIRLQSELNLKSLFVKNVAHEIRTPLNIAIVGLDILSRRMKDAHNSDPANDDSLQVVEEINDSTKVAVRILDDLLAYEKLSTGVFQVEKSNCSIANLVRECSALFAIQARGCNIDYSILQNENVISETAIVFADPGKITQVLRNFISNAIKFTPDGGCVRVVAFAAEGNAVIQVIDSGAGMTPAQIELIFKDIVQFDANALQKGGGSGIGLWVCKKIIDVHGGNIKADSKGKGRGCTFELQLPLGSHKTELGQPSSYRVHPQLENASNSNTRRQMKIALTRYQKPVNRIDGRDALQGLRALIVDDSKLNRKFLYRLLAPICSHVEEAENGRHCMSIIKASEDSFDFIIMDKHMPDMNGLETTFTLRKQRYTGIIIGLTGDAAAEDILVFLENGADDCLIKPVTYEQLESCIAALLDSRATLDGPYMNADDDLIIIHKET